MNSGDGELFERCMSVGGVAVMPTDTVYGLACEADDKQAVTRLYALKGRVPDKPAAVMFFDVDLALAALPDLGPRSVEAVRRLLPGPATLLLPNPFGRFPLACAGDHSVLGLRVPRCEGSIAPLGEVRWPVIQSSANLAGGPDPRTLEEIPSSIREGCDLILDGGELPGLASTVIGMLDYERLGEWTLIREGAMPAEQITELLG